MMFVMLSLIMIFVGFLITINPVLWFELVAIWTEKKEKPKPSRGQKALTRLISFLIFAAGVAYMVLFILQG